MKRKTWLDYPDNLDECLGPIKEKDFPEKWHVESDFIAFSVVGPVFAEGYRNSFAIERDAYLVAAAPEMWRVLREILRTGVVDRDAINDAIGKIAP